MKKPIETRIEKLEKKSGDTIIGVTLVGSGIYTVNGVTMTEEEFNQKYPDAVTIVIKYDQTPAVEDMPKNSHF